MAVQLSDMVELLRFYQVEGPVDVDIRGLAYDSREVMPGSCFIARRGFVHDGHDFIPEAVARGAVAVVVEREAKVPAGVTRILVPDGREAQARMAAGFYGHPTKRMRLMGVTGTNGKTTTTMLIQAVLEAGGLRTGLVGTIEHRVGDEVVPAVRTTPEALDLQRLFYRIVEDRCEACVMEVASHALELKRVEGCEFDVGVLTNLTQDHLDFHGDMARYTAAKALLFEGLGRSYFGPPKDGPKVAVLNVDDPSSAYFAERTDVPIVTYGLSEQAAFRATDVQVGGGAGGIGVAFTALTPAGKTRLKLRLSGRFNVYNALAALAVGVTEGVSLERCKAALEAVTVPGRFEPVDAGQPFGVVVDYAHTPDGLENVLHAAGDIAKGRVICVFGCGGDRDRTKRPVMGEIAGRLADYAVLTSDNPRSEDPQAILREIEAGIRPLKKRGEGYSVVVDRKRAISRAFREARPGDLVLIAGKGHETYQQFRDRTIPFDDRDVARQALKSLGWGQR